jgi:hypothetical protein
MFIKFKDAFLNMDGIFAIARPDHEYPHGALQPMRGEPIPLDEGEYTALSCLLFAAGSIDLGTVRGEIETYHEAATRAVVRHVLQTKAAIEKFDQTFRHKSETNQPPSTSQPVNTEPPREQVRVNPLPPSITNRPGVFPDPYEEL